MSKFINADEIRDRITISSLLSHLGYEPAFKSGKELFYVSMLRDSDTKASLCVDDKKGAWHDWGGSNRTGIKGGDIVNFGLAYWPGIPFLDVLSKIITACDIPLSEVQQITQPKKKRERIATKIPNYLIEKIQPVGTNAALNGYLKARGIFEVAGDLSEVYYYVIDEKQLKKNFFAIGWQNSSGGWELNNKYFKGCLGKKGTNFIEGQNNDLEVFEARFDYLSWRLDNMDSKSNIMILNSLSFLAEAINVSKGFTNVRTYFDLDAAGINATKEFLALVPNSIDNSIVFAPYKDCNCKTMALLNIKENRVFDGAFERKIGR